MTATSAVLDLRHVTKTFPRRAGPRHGGSLVAVDDVSLAVDEGEIVGLVGESGAGKSTIGRIALGLERADTGQVVFEGVDLAHLSDRRLRPHRRRMHLVLQDPFDSLHPAMRVGRIVAEPLAVAGRRRGDRQAAAFIALEEVGLVPAADVAARWPHELSGGQRQRVALARALVARPRLVVADEPTSMLDASLRAGILDLLDGMRTRLGTAVVFITHDLAVARQVCDRIAVLHEGRLVEVADAETVVHQPAHDYTKTLLAASKGDI